MRVSDRHLIILLFLWRRNKLFTFYFTSLKDADHTRKVVKCSHPWIRYINFSDAVDAILHCKAEMWFLVYMQVSSRSSWGTTDQRDKLDVVAVRTNRSNNLDDIQRWRQFVMFSSHCLSTQEKDRRTGAVSIFYVMHICLWKSQTNNCASMEILTWYFLSPQLGNWSFGRTQPAAQRPWYF